MVANIFKIDSRDKAAVFLDSRSIRYSLEVLNSERNLDYVKLLRLLHSPANDGDDDYNYITNISYYAPIVLQNANDEVSPMVKLLEWLGYNGVRVVSRRVIGSSDSSESAGFCVDITIDAMQLIPVVDQYIFFAGSPQLLPLFRHLRTAGKKVNLVAVSGADGSGDRSTTTAEMRRNVNAFIEFEEVLKLCLKQK